MAVSEAAQVVLERASAELGTPVYDVPFEIFNTALKPKGISVSDCGHNTIRFVAPEKSFDYDNDHVLRVGGTLHAVHSAEHPPIIVGVELKWEIRYEGVGSYFTPFGFDAFEEAAAVAALLHKGSTRVDLSEPLIDMPVPPWVAGGEDWIHETGRVAPETSTLTLAEARKVFDKWKASFEAVLGSS